MSTVAGADAQLLTDWAPCGIRPPRAGRTNRACQPDSAPAIGSCSAAGQVGSQAQAAQGVTTASTLARRRPHVAQQPPLWQRVAAPSPLARQRGKSARSAGGACGPRSPWPPRPGAAHASADARPEQTRGRSFNRASGTNQRRHSRHGRLRRGLDITAHGHHRNKTVKKTVLHERGAKETKGAPAVGLTAESAVASGRCSQLRRAAR